jgi:Recombination endonuclease VII
MGRRASEARQQALKEGRKTYHGKPCKKCGGMEKYVSSNGCIECGKESTKGRYKQNPEYFKEYDKQRYKQNPGYFKEKDKERYKQNPGYYKEKNLRRFNLTLEMYNRLLEYQTGVCWICKLNCDINDNLSVDHDHKTSLVRGLLCHDCNTRWVYMADARDWITIQLKPGGMQVYKALRDYVYGTPPAQRLFPGLEVPEKQKMKDKKKAENREKRAARRIEKYKQALNTPAMITC